MALQDCMLPGITPTGVGCAQEPGAASLAPLWVSQQPLREGSEGEAVLHPSIADRSKCHIMPACTHHALIKR